MNVYYWRTWYKAVCGGKGGSEGHALRDTTSRGLRGRVCPPHTSERGGRGGCEPGGGREGGERRRGRRRVLLRERYRYRTHADTQGAREQY